MIPVVVGSNPIGHPSNSSSTCGQTMFQGVPHARFKNVTRDRRDRSAILMFVIGGNAPSAEFTRESMAELERKGVWPPTKRKARTRR